MRILPWVPWSKSCSRNLIRSCQDSQYAIKRVIPGGQVKLFLLIPEITVTTNHIAVFYKSNSSLADTGEGR